MSPLQNAVAFTIIIFKQVGSSCFAAASLDKDAAMQQTGNKLFLPMKSSACFNTQTSQAYYWYWKH